MVCHRNTPYVRPAVDSIFDQTLSDWEFIFVSNGSGLAPSDLGAMGSDPRLRWVELSENMGISHGLNAGIEVVTGDYVGFLDSDDIALPARLERQVALMQSDPLLGLVNCGVMTIDDTGRVTGREFVLIEGDAQQVFSAYYSSTITSAFMVRREVAKQYNLRPDFTTGVDYDFFSRIGDQWRMGGVPEVLLHYRRHLQQITVESRDEQVLNECIVRLATARRRSGREEELAELSAEFGAWRQQPPKQSVTFAAFARRYLSEGYPTIAVYHVRKLLGVDRGPRALFFAGKVLGAAVVREPLSTWWFLRLFFTGPVRAHGLRPF